MTDSEIFAAIEKVVHDYNNLTIKRPEAVEKVKELAKKYKAKQIKIEFKHTN